MWKYVLLNSCDIIDKQCAKHTGSVRDVTDSDRPSQKAAIMAVASRFSNIDFFNIFFLETKQTNKSIEKSCCRSLFDSSPIDGTCDVASIGLPSYK